MWWVMCSSCLLCELLRRNCASVGELRNESGAGIGQEGWIRHILDVIGTYKCTHMIVITIGDGYERIVWSGAKD